MENEKIEQIIKNSKKNFIFENRTQIFSSISVFLSAINSPTKEKMNELVMFFHKLKGTAITLGFEEIYNIGFECEKILDSYMENDNYNNNLDETFQLKIVSSYSQILYLIDCEYQKYIKVIENDSVEIKSVMTTLFSQIIERNNFLKIKEQKILIADDNITYTGILKGELVGHGFEVHTVQNNDEAINLVTRKQFDLIIMSAILPARESDKNEFEVYRIIKESGYEGAFVFLTEKNIVQDRITALKIGVDDYFVKPFNIEEFILKIKKILYTRTNIYIKTIYDGLTEAYTREHFYNRIKLIMENFEESGNEFSLVLIDLDDYGRVNKDHGFFIGDMLLKKFVEAVKSYIKSDLIFRFEGDKFVILFENNDSQKTIKIIQKMADEFRKIQFMSHAIHLSFSASVYTIANGYENIEEIIDKLYDLNKEIKTSKKGNIRIVSEEKVEIQKTTQKIKILIADDAEIINHIIKAKLEDMKYKIYYARDGVEAVTKCRELRPDLIILDLLMPKMSGFEVCSALKNETKTKDIKIIILSSMNKTDDVIKCFKMGVDAYMVKPFSVEELEERIKSILK